MLLAASRPGSAYNGKLTNKKVGFRPLYAFAI
jgi:hypothetical protein